MKKLILIFFVALNVFSQEITVGSKKFTESVVIGEIVTQLIRSTGVEVEHREQLGGTRVLWNGLLKDELDIYPDYTGTLIFEIFSEKEINSFEELKEELKKSGIGITKSLGFNNTYAIGMNREQAEKLNIKSISDLNNYPELSIGFTNEFMDRSDGWPALKEAYNLSHTNVRGLDHDLAYKGLAERKIDVIDLYSTDAEIDFYDIEILEDNKNHFAEYLSVILFNNELRTTYPEAIDLITELENSLTKDDIIKLNSAVKIDNLNEKEVAASFIKDKFNLKTDFDLANFWQRLSKNTLDHLALVAISLFAAIILSIPLGIYSFRKKKIGKLILNVVGVIQTIPSLALLVLMIPLFGIGFQPAAFALFLYSLLPIVRNTYLGFEDIDKSIRESAEVLGLKKRAILFEIELPIAFRSILSGVKTSGVINVGTTTLGALIGAGGYGQPILTGIRLDNMALILEGAVPAALLAIFITALFDLLEKLFVPEGIRLSS